VTTPSAIKSVFLKYVENLDRIVDESRPRSVEMEKEAEDILGVLGMWRKSVLIMDEVDMLLHPLKSELNFPIGRSTTSISLRRAGSCRSTSSTPCSTTTPSASRRK
jgi:hypothetical protein